MSVGRKLLINGILQAILRKAQLMPGFATYAVTGDKLFRFG